MKVEVLAPGLDVVGIESFTPLFRQINNQLSRHSKIDSAGLSYFQYLMKLFGFVKSNTGYPASQFLAAATNCERPGHGLCVTPVYFEAGVEKVFLRTLDQSQLEEEKVAQLIKSLNQHLEADGLHLDFIDMNLWWMNMPEHLDIQTVPLDAAINQSIYSRLPEGKDSIYWHRLMNEMQMLLFSHEVNRQREQEGQLPINGLWLWGEGELPEVQSEPVYDCVITNSLLVKGMARVRNVPVISFSEINSTLGQYDRLLVVDDRALFDTASDSVEQGAELCQPLFDMCSAIVNEVKLDSLKWYADLYSLEWKKPFWRFLR